MESTNKNIIVMGLQRIKNSYQNVDPVKAVKTVTAFSKIFFIFSILFLAAFIFKWIKLDFEKASNFKLLISNIDILPLYQSSKVTFVFISIYEIIKMLVVSMTFYFFIKFLNSIDINDPFKNIKSKEYLNLVAILSGVFFSIDAIGMMHLAYFQDLLALKSPLRMFHFEFLFLTYFIHVFSVIFKRGVDLNNEIDLVI